MLAALVIALREGLEAALIVGIVFAYLAKLGRRDGFAAVWGGIGSAVLVSAAVAALFLGWLGGYGGEVEELYEIVAMLSAVAVLTYVIVWMHNQMRGHKAQLEARVAGALEQNSLWALGVLVFVIVAREGIELVLFLYAAAITSTPLQAVAGTLLGISAAAALGYAIYRGSRRLNLRAFFTVTGSLLVVFGAGLLGKSVHGLQEIGAVPFMTGAVWDTSGLLSEESPLGTFLSTVAGYDPEPTALQLIAYILYVAVAGWALLKPAPRAGHAAARPAAAGAGSRWRMPAAVGAMLVLAVSVVAVPALRAKEEQRAHAAAAVQARGPAVDVTMTARRYEFEPRVLTVAPGTPVNLTVHSVDGTHGVAYPGGNVPVPGGKSATVRFITPLEPGDYEFACMIPCGTGHDAMKWHLKVVPEGAR